MTWQIDEDKPFFSIGAVAEILGVKPRMLRLYEENGLLLPGRTDTNRRQYSLKDISRIAYLNYLSSVKKVNLAGLVEIQRIIEKMDARQQKALIEEGEMEIKSLPQDAKKRFSDPDDQNFKETMNELSENSELKEELNKLRPG